VISEQRAQAEADKAALWPGLGWRTLWRNFHAQIVARKFLQDVGVLSVANVAGAALNFAQGILVARWLGPEQYGVVGLILSYPNFIYALFDARSVDASVKYLSEYHSRGDREGALAVCRLGCAVDLGVACLTFLVLAFTARLAAASIVHDPAVAGLIILYGAALVPRALVGTSNAVLAALGRFPVLALLGFATTFLRALLIVGFVLAGWQVRGVILANAVAAAVTGLFYGALTWNLMRGAWGSFNPFGNLKALKGGRRQIFSFLAYNNLNTLVATIPNQLDLLLLGYFRGPTEAGYFRLAKNLSTAVRFFTKPLQTVSYPALARLWASGDRPRFSRKVWRLALWVGLPSGFLVLLGTGALSYLLPLLVGDDFLPAVSATQLLWIGAAISLAFFWTRPLYLARGQIKRLFVVSSIVTIIFALFYPFVIRAWGYVGAAAWLLSLQIAGVACGAFWLWTPPAQARAKQPPDATRKNDEIGSSIQCAKRADCSDGCKIY
jgi:O-antigen/teichoic acid export membrane protein